MRFHYLAFVISVFINSFDYAVPLTLDEGPIVVVPKLDESPFVVVPELDGPDWDLLVFTQQWPVTVCREWKDRNPYHKCSMPPDPKAWSIHGIWPTKLHTMGPSFCNKTWHFDYKLIEPIENELNSSWKNIESETSTYALWAHEWTKHGTCAAILEPLNSEFKYFSKGLELFKTYNMENVLNGDGFYPSNDKGYPLADIVTRLGMHISRIPMIQCRREHGKNWLSEIRLCFDKRLQLQDCTGVMHAPTRTIRLRSAYASTITNCVVNEPIYYPESENAYPTKEYVPSVYVPFYLLISWLQWFTM